MSHVSPLTEWIDASAEAEMPEYRCKRYSKVELVEVLHSFGVTDLLAVKAMWFTLERAGRDYLRPRPAQRNLSSARKRLTQLLALAEQTQTSLDEILSCQTSDDESDAIHRELAKRIDRAAEHLAFKNLASAAQQPSYTMPDTISRPSGDSILKDVAGLVAVCREALEHLNKGQAGRRANHRLHLWVLSVSRAWQEAGQRVRHDPDSYKGGTSYANFMWWALNVIDPDALSKLSSALSEYRTEENRSQRRGVSSQ